MTMDAHQHVWRIARGDYGWLTPDRVPSLCRDFMPEDLAPLLATHGIDRTILVQAAPTLAETQFLLDIAARTPFVAGVVGWCDFEGANAAEVIAALAASERLVGLRPMLQDLSDDRWILRRDLEPALKAMKQADLALDLLVLPRHLPHISAFLERHADLRAVIDHGAKPYIATGEIDPWAAAMRRIARETNAFCKLSGLLTEAGERRTRAALQPYVDVLLQAFGPRRMMWGSDWPVLTLAADYGQWLDLAHDLTAALSADERDDLFGRSAARFYRVDTP